MNQAGLSTPDAFGYTSRMRTLFLAVAGAFLGSASLWLGVYLRPEHRGESLIDFFKWTLTIRDRVPVAVAEITLSLLGAIAVLAAFG